MRKLISILIFILVATVSIVRAENTTPESIKKMLITKVDRNVMAMELMFTNQEVLTKKTLYHRYWIVMMDYRKKIREVESVEELENISTEIQEWNSINLQLLNRETQSLERELSTVIEVEEIKKLVLNKGQNF